MRLVAVVWMLCGGISGGALIERPPAAFPWIGILMGVGVVAMILFHNRIVAAVDALSDSGTKRRGIM